MKLWLYRVLVAVDLLLAAIFRGKRNETLSAMAYSTELNQGNWGIFWRPMIDFVFSWAVQGHCKIQYEIERRWNQGFNNN